MKTPAVLAAALASLAAAATLHAQTRVVYVDQTAPAGGDGTSWSRAFRELDVAIAAAAVGNDVHAYFRIAQGTYRPRNMSPERRVAFDLGSSTTSAAVLSLTGSFAGLRGPDPDARDFARTPTILSGDVLGNDAPDGSGREDNATIVLLATTRSQHAPQYVELDGIAIQSSAPGNAAIATVLSASNGSVFVYDCQFRDNHGTGLAVSGTSATILQSSFLRNRGLMGGGLWISASGSYIARCRFESNSAEFGGGLYVDRWGVQGRELRIMGNSASVNGGGVFGADRCSFSDSLVAANTAGIGGGLFGLGTAINCTIAHNAADWGGGVHAFGGYIANSIVAENSASRGGPQVSISHSAMQVHSCIIEGGLAAIYRAFDASVVADQLWDLAPGFLDAAGPDGNPASWGDNDYHLRFNALAVNRGLTGPAHSFDLDGHPRIQPRYPGGPALPDLGCFEYQPRCPADSNQDDGVTTDDLLDFLSAYTFGQPLADIDDGSATNTPDDGVTIDDLLYFLVRFEAGC
jgi:hypothetical protein